MNRDRIKQLRDHLAGLPDERFTMAMMFGQEVELEGLIPHPAEGDEPPAVMLNECGTAACIAGWTLVLFKPDDADAGSIEAMQLLGITYGEHWDLFCPTGYEHMPYTRAMAIETLDHLLETGEVRWPSFAS